MESSDDCQNGETVWHAGGGILPMLLTVAKYILFCMSGFSAIFMPTFKSTYSKN